MTNIERAAEIIYRGGPSWPSQTAQALADAGLLKTEEEQAVLEAAVKWRPRCGQLGPSVDAYLATKGNPS